MRNKVQGQVAVEAVVLADGTVGDVRLVTSLDPDFGLNQAAVDTAKQWVFRPARDGNLKPVPVVIMLTFDLKLH